MFKEERDELKFDWNMIGNIGEGRPNLGNTMDVSVYRLMQFTLRDVLIKEFNGFIVELQELFKKLKMNILRIETADLEKMAFTLTLAEDLDCSGLPASDETVCTYDEGFLSGLLSGYTGKNFSAKEVDCWCSGDRGCRFEAKSVA